ncbi:hypothetical protein BJ742DRAFT_819744 [Cladochytrium replicatum]|nr:hypothetical protein BJ742DRAFT_819744 [Cladochytrium replicatum]
MLMMGLISKAREFKPAATKEEDSTQTEDGAATTTTNGNDGKAVTRLMAKATHKLTERLQGAIRDHLAAEKGKQAEKKKEGGALVASFDPRKPMVATASYEDAVKRCNEKVSQIVSYCKRHNVKFRDPYFDFGSGAYTCVLKAGSDNEELFAASQEATVRRVHQIFEKPCFVVDGYDSADIRQGKIGTCYFLAALASLAAMPKLIERICVARDERIGVYGFVFFRDGEWTSVVVDDQLLIDSPDFEKSDTRLERSKYESVYMKGSDSLLYSACKNPQETWLPLLEKAYAKLHASYEAIDGGRPGAAVEDLTGGLTTALSIADVLDPELLWEDLKLANHDRIFSVSIVGGDDTLKTSKDLVLGHAYSIQKAIEVKGKRMVQLRNPWGKFEWKGPWGDGSAEWTPEWMQLLDHKFGDDGVFWMEYADFLREWAVLDKTRLFSDEWSVVNRWLNLQATIPSSHNIGIFTLNVECPTAAVITLSQLDMSFFGGIEGAYMFKLKLKLMRQVEDKEVEVDDSEALFATRSVSLEVDLLEPGTYRVYAFVQMIKVRDQTREEQITQMPEMWLTKLEDILKSFAITKAKIGAQIAEAEIGEWEDEGEVEEAGEEQAEEAKPEAEGEAAATEDPAAEETQEDEEEIDEIVPLRLTVYSKDAGLQIVSASTFSLLSATDEERQGVAEALRPDPRDRNAYVLLEYFLTFRLTEFSGMTL